MSYRQLAFSRLRHARRAHPYSRVASRRPASSRQLFAAPRPTRATHRVGNRGIYSGRRGPVRGRGTRRYRRTLVRRRRRGARGSRHSSARLAPPSKISRLAHQIAEATGNRYIFNLTSANEFQVPYSTGTDNEHAAQYVFQRENVPNENDPMIYPLNNQDLANIMNQVFGVTWPFPAGIRSTQMYDTFIHIGYTVKFSLRNQNSNRTRFEAITMEARHDLSRPGTDNVDWENPFNIAGAYLARMQDTSITDNTDASNRALHFIRTKFEQLPPIRRAFRTKKITFTLEPGEQRNFIVKGFRKFNYVDLYGHVLVTSPAPNILQRWYRGTKTMVFKMLSEPADYADAELNALVALSTRTTPVCLLTADTVYYCVKPAQVPAVKHVGFGGNGMVSGVIDTTKIENMNDADYKDVAQGNAI